MMENDQQALFAGLLERARGEARRHDVEIETVLSIGPVTSSLFEEVRMKKIDRPVLGIQPGHGLPGWLAGSTAHDLAERAPCDVLGVH